MCDLAVEDEKSAQLIFEIRRRFLACISVPDNFGHVTTDWEFQKRIFRETLGDAEVFKFPMRSDYQRKFAKMMVDIFERQGQGENYDLFFDRLSDLYSAEDGPTHYRHFLLGRGEGADRLIVEESRSLISEGTTGLCSWQGAEVLAEWCIHNGSCLSDKTVLELGSGVGLTGLTVLSLCSLKKFVFSDCHPRVLSLLRSNIELNSKQLHSPREVLDLAWEDVTEALKTDLNVDVVLAADVIYDNSLFPSLIIALKIFLNSENSFGVIALTVRNEHTVAQFFELLRSEGFIYEELDTPEFSIFVKTDLTPVKVIKLFYRSTNRGTLRR